MTQPRWSPDEPLIKGSLDHTAGLIEGAEALLEKNLPHLSFHLALLALEEIGKLEVVLMGRSSSDEDEGAFQKKFLDDHVGKIFWAFWGPTFSRELIDRKQIEWHQSFAKMLHQKRLRGLYVEPGEDGFIAPSEHVSSDDAQSLIDMARIRLEMQRELRPADLNDEERADLAWFQKAHHNQENRDFIMSGPSQHKLVELQDIRAWMKWLRESVETRESELLALAEAEMHRQVKLDDAHLPKWKFRIRLKTNSHFIRPKAIKAWNKMDIPIKWFFVDKKKTDQLIVEFLLPKAIHGTDLYQAGLTYAYRFTVALNIGSQGFFWFDLPLQTERFDESIEDLETGALLHVGRAPVKRVEREVENLNETHIFWTTIAYSLLPRDGPEVLPLRHYLDGLMYWAKTDIHSGFEVHAFRAFFDAFQKATLLFGDWDGKSPYREALLKALTPHVKNVEEAVDEIMSLSEKYQAGQPFPEVNVEQAAVMKLFTDVYLISGLHEVARRRAEPPEPPSPGPALA